MFAARQGFFSNITTPITTNSFIARIDNSVGGNSAGAIDSSGNIYITVLYAPSYGGNFILKLSGTDSSIIWQQVVNGSDSYTFYQMVTDNSDIYLGGFKSTAPTQTLSNSSFSNSSGAVNYQKGLTPYVGIINSLDINNSTNYIYFGGNVGAQGQLLYYSNGGILQLQKNLIVSSSSSNPITSIKYDNSASTLTFCGTATISATQYAFIGYTNSSLALTSYARITTSGITSYGCAIGASSSKYLIGISGSNSRLIKFNAALTTITYQVSISNINLYSIVSDGSNVYIVGAVIGGGGGIYIAKLSSTNVVLWQRTVTSTVAIIPTEIKLNGSYVYIFGTMDNNSSVIKMKNDGSVLGTFIGAAGTFTFSATTATYTTTSVAFTNSGAAISNTSYASSNFTTSWIPGGLSVSATGT